MPLRIAYKWARRIVITLIGFTVLAVGAAMLVLPGPGLLVMAVGLGVLSLEFAWARHWLKEVKRRGNNFAQSVLNNYGRRKPA
ncbi:MAG: PGPGW domain-containing protein, partial [Steroidobacteraceae bacterium]|nr:PGPGW domain-containing protein [Steroidobacteraceae bacterium]MDW8258490.1 PGPGW domain-containing protein [Gammaproteobacteria bacterium]